MGGKWDGMGWDGPDEVEVGRCMEWGGKEGGGRGERYKSEVRERERLFGSEKGLRLEMVCT